MWMGWAWIFLFLRLHELMSFHERLGWIVHHVLSGLNLYGFAWLLPYGVACLMLIIICFRFCLELSAATRWRVALGASLFLMGAMGCELSAWRLVRMDAAPLFWLVEIVVEVVLEIALA